MSGNVIHVDFGARRFGSLDIGIQSDILFCDEYATLLRVTMTCLGEVTVRHVFVEHD